jgi:hypothetical protein
LSRGRRGWRHRRLRYDVAVIRESRTFQGWLTSTLWTGAGRLAGQRPIDYRIRRVD